MKKYCRFLIVFFILIFFAVIMFPYVKAEYLTIKHGQEFVGLEEQTNILSDSTYLKVIKYSEEQATVFYVSDTGDLITFIKENNEWKLHSWKTIWSTSGSADSFYWPYYR